MVVKAKCFLSLSLCLSLLAGTLAARDDDAQATVALDSEHFEKVSEADVSKNQVEHLQTELSEIKAALAAATLRIDALEASSKKSDMLSEGCDDIKNFKDRMKCKASQALAATTGYQKGTCANPKCNREAVRNMVIQNCETNLGIKVSTSFAYPRMFGMEGDYLCQEFCDVTMRQGGAEVNYDYIFRNHDGDCVIKITNGQQINMPKVS
eukprot:TRINITY_DN1893_c0_g1_i7.p1 TRINITY_DN1893_c0_g1~~TRINITY_DN1893_c0_g1_i7.p1  ORF type:complete len:231 (+),score=36.43 TRINITY_DN1893_c0_g1_i7:69-695(+)